MNDSPSQQEARRTIRRCRLITGLLILGSLAGILGGAVAVNGLSAAEFLARFGSPKALFLLGVFYLIYIPASLRIYYILLLNAQGVFTALERRAYQESKQRWEKYLLKSALLAGTLVILVLIATMLNR